MVRGRGLAGAARRGGQAALILAALALAACAPRLDLPGPDIAKPVLTGNTLVAADGRELTVRRYDAENPKALIVAAHGFNDYGNAFALAAPWFNDHGISLITYDQRGFGETPTRGMWPGVEALARDYATLVALARDEYPDLPLYLLGVSMGGAVVTTAVAEEGVTGDGLILSGPAFWGWHELNPLYRGTLWLAAHTVPGYKLTGEGLELWPSDNIEMLRALSRDPLMIRATRIDTIYGLVNLMDEAYLAAPKVTLPTLVLFGEKDEIVPQEPVDAVAERLAGPVRYVTYPKGWHMLLRDLQRARVYADIAAWMEEPDGPLPSEHISETPELASGTD